VLLLLLLMLCGDRREYFAARLLCCWGLLMIMMMLCGHTPSPLQKASFCIQQILPVTAHPRVLVLLGLNTLSNSPTA
jgi:hypothetical protein